MNYTEEQVKEMIKLVLEKTSSAFFEYLKNETIIVDATTRKEIPNSELDVDPNSIRTLTDYVYDKLKLSGIDF